MRPIDSSTPINSGPVSSDLNPETPNSSAPPSPAIDQPAEPPDPGAAAAKRMEKDMEATYFKGVLLDAGAQRGTQVLYDRNVKPDAVGSTETAGPVAAPVRVADAGDDVNLDVRAGAGHLIGQKEIGSGECFDMVDYVLRQAGAKSAGDFEKITGKRDQDYKWGTPIDVKDAKPGDVLQFRDHHVNIDTVTKTTRTFPDGHSTTTIDETKTSYNRSPQHTSLVLSNEGNGRMTVSEQHVIDRDSGKPSHTVHKNDLYTQDGTTKSTRNTMEGDVKVKIEKTVTVTTEGQVWAYRPQPKDDKK